MTEVIVPLMTRGMSEPPYRYHFTVSNLSLHACLVTLTRSYANNTAFGVEFFLNFSFKKVFFFLLLVMML